MSVKLNGWLNVMYIIIRCLGEAPLMQSVFANGKFILQQLYSQLIRFSSLIKHHCLLVVIGSPKCLLFCLHPGTQLWNWQKQMWCLEMCGFKEVAISDVIVIVFTALRLKWPGSKWLSSETCHFLVNLLSFSCYFTATNVIQ